MEKRDVIVKYKQKILDLANVIGIGWGMKEVGGQRTSDEAIHILVEKKVPKDMLNKRDLIPGKIAGLPTDVLEVGQIRALLFTTRTERKRPAQPGMSIGHYLITAGTFGAVVYDAATGHPLILSNNHVLANTSTRKLHRAKVGDPILQPGVYDGGQIDRDVIAFLDRYHPLTLKGGLASTPNVVDCAVAFPVNQKVIEDRILEIGTVRGVRTPEIGETVYKSGRTTGLTKGTVKTLDATLTVQMSDGEEAVFMNQILVDMKTEGGDSGALVVDGERRACGLLFAGSGQVMVCNPIQAVLDALHVTVEPKVK